MNGWNFMAKTFIYLGIFFIVLGVLFLLADKLPFRLGRLPGDIVYHKGNFSFYFPWVSCLVVSVVLSLLFMLFKK
ncbi:MAG: DUF2905 domain-containing protein [Desulfonauticus sp.]|nr:DUF2905 domain-containing protein [Desulfonauticus sp.]